jgi:serine protease Do
MIKKFYFWFFAFVYICNNLLSQYSINDSRSTAITRAIEKVGPAVACINVEENVSAYASPDPFFRYFFPPEIYPMKSSGSGVVISPDGYVLTNTHVVEKASKITVTLSGGEEYSAEVVGVDKTSDLALLLLEGEDFPFAKLGNSDDLIIGEWVIALGNPFELFSISNQPTASVGIISANRMNFGMQKESGRVLQNMIQTDAAINPGNSGGPLVNSNGDVIGINTFIFTGSNYNRGSIGIGFAIPINTAKRIAQELKTSGSIDRSFTTGLVVQPLTRGLIRHLNIPFRDGVIVVHVDKNSPAQEAGISIGDIIVTAANKKVNSPSNIRDIIAEKDLRSGDRIILKIYRDGSYKNIKLRLGTYK